MEFLGIDLTSSPERPSAFAILDEVPCLTSHGSFAADEELLELAAQRKPALIAIDAPLGLPWGLHCLEDNCVCEPLLDYAGRAAEQMLARRGIGCFFTTKRSIIKAMVYRGIRLSKLLAREGHTVIEVYPYATRRILFGDVQPRKQTAAGLAFLQQRLTPRVQGVDGLEMNHDLGDALLASFTAHLHHRGQTETLGIPEEGCIVIPWTGR